MRAIVKGNQMFPFRLAFILIGCLFLAACGDVVAPVVLVPCPSGTCWDLSDGALLDVNDAPSEARLGFHDVHAWRVMTIPGHRYLILTRVFSGSADTYVALSPILDPFTNIMTDVRSDGGVSFTATTGAAFIAVGDRGNDAGTEYSVRVVSYDEGLEPLPGTTALAINSPPVPRALAPGEIGRFVFDAMRDEDYTIRVVTIRGAVKTFASLIPSVDDDVYDLADTAGVIAFRATETGRYYVAVLDRGGVAGSEFGIEITSP
ncbi:MAG: hypothetical protein HY207_06710 [Nitrospirae bacterium]|nr:hypothetical protein [Nitrospirota bacterium]